METFHAWSKAIPTFFFVKSRMRVLILGWSVGRIEPPPPQKKSTKKPTKKSQEALEWEALVPQEYIES